MEEELVIEKCVLYLRAEESATVHKGGSVSLRSLMPVTLPKLKCLDGDNKYQPYVEHTPESAFLEAEKDPEKKPSAYDRSNLFGNALTEKQKSIYDAFRSGERLSDIARRMKMNPGTVHSQLRVAKAKMGEAVPEYTKTRVRLKKEDYLNRPLSSKENEIYQMALSGLTPSQIGARIGLDRKKISDTLRRVRLKKGGNYGK